MQPLQLDVFSDIACPWCFIGKRRLEMVLADEPGPVEVRWRAYQLSPDLPAEGVDAAEYFAKKFGSLERIRQIQGRVAEVGLGDGIRFDFEAQRRASNTRLAHRLVKLAARRGLGSDAKEALFRGHFEEGIDVGSLEACLGLFEKHGVAIDPAVLRQEIADGEGDAEVQVDLQLAQQIGVTGVPFFIGNGIVAMSGAQDPATFRRFLAKAREPVEQRPV